MKYFIICLLVASTLSQKLITEEVYSEVKKNASWESYDVEENPFKSYTQAEIGRLMGTYLKYDDENPAPVTNDFWFDTSFPESFDARKEWSNCRQEVKNQQGCGSCWAFSGTTALAHRFCVASQGKLNVSLSPQDSVSCDKNNNGCNGGILSYTWYYFERIGNII